VTQQTPTLDIIIVNWNTGNRLRECLSSISLACHDPTYVIACVTVIDNASVDGSADGLPYPELPLRVIRNQDNRGFAAACNQGIPGSEADYLLFLNPDSQLLEDTLAKSIACMSAPEHARTGILGVQLLDDDGAVARTCARFPTTGCYIAKMLGLSQLFPSIFPDHFYKEWDHQQSRTIEQVMGAYFFVRRSVFNDAGGFDERYFLYFEEVDLSLIAQRAGWTTYYLASAQCRHSGHGSTRQMKARRLFYFLRSRLFYGFKNFGLASAVILLLATLLIEPFSRLAQAILRGSLSQMRELFQGYILLWQSLPSLLRSTYLRKPQVLKLGLGEL
jgi:GT2 family glycosyltransferase